MPVGSISFNKLMWAKLVCKSTGEDKKIWPGPTTHRSIVPNNVPSLDAHSNFISDTRAIEFVGVPSLAEWCGLVDHEVSSIDSNLA